MAWAREAMVHGLYCFHKKPELLGRAKHCSLPSLLADLDVDMDVHVEGEDKNI